MDSYVPHPRDAVGNEFHVGRWVFRMMKRLIVPICCLVAGVVAGFVACRLLSVPKPTDKIGPTSTEFAVGTLYDLHRGGESEAIQRSIAVTLAQMYIDAEDRDEDARRMITSMSAKVPVLAEELQAIEQRQRGTQSAGDGWDAPCDTHGTRRNCTIGCPGDEELELELVDLLRMFSRIGEATFKYNTNDVQGVKRDWNDLGMDPLSKHEPHWTNALSQLLPTFGFTYRQDVTDTNVYHIIKMKK